MENEIKIGTRVLVLHGTGEPFYSGKVKALTKSHALVRCEEFGWYTHWWELKRLEVVNP